MEEHTIYIDATDMTTFFVHDAYHSGTIKIYSKNRPVETLTFEPERSWDPQEAIFDTLKAWNLAEEEEDPYDYDTICDSFFTRMTVNRDSIVRVESLDWQKAKCTCQCGDEVTHKTSPIPPAYGEVFKQITEVV